MLVLFIMCRQFNILTLILNCFDWCLITILGPHKRVQVWCMFLFICIVCYYWYNLKSTTLSRFFFTISVQASNVANVLLFCFAVQLRYIQDLYITRACILFLLMYFKLFLIKFVPLEYNKLLLIIYMS